MAGVLLCSANIAVADDYLGTWVVAKASTAPWLEKQGDLQPHIPKDMEKATLVFTEDRLTAPLDWMGCKNPSYKQAEYPFEGLFEGGLYDRDRGLTDAAGLAKMLGFSKTPVPSLTTSCSELIYHFADSDTMLFALDNVIYTLKRMK